MHTARLVIIAGIAALAIKGDAVSVSAQKLTNGPPTRGVPMCLGERATDVVQPGEEYYGHTERDVVVVLGHGAKVFTADGDDLVCVYGDGYGVGSEIDLGSGHNTVITYGGDNTITAYGGNDLIYLNGGHETVHAGMGNDHIWANGAESAEIYGESGTDLIVGSPGNDVLDGGDHDDVLLGNDGDDTISGGVAGQDTLFGGAGFDTLDGGYGFMSIDHCIDTTPGGATFIECEIQTATPTAPVGEAAAVP